MDTSIMVARSIQISLPEELVAEVDRQAEAKKAGRSAFIRRALIAYLKQRTQQEVDEAYVRGYRGRSRKVLSEFSDLLRGQSWPEK